MSVAEFFVDQEVLITGGSGFIGKALLEKLLRSCPGVRRIYVLMRVKKSRNAAERMLDIFASPFFDRLRREQPHALDKVSVIEGDCSELGLAIKPEDLDRIKDVNIVYHSAASVRFDDHLREAILLNTRGTLEMLKLAEGLQNLKVFVHVSTTYANPDKYEVEEKVYPPYADWRTTIKLAETYDTHLLNILDKKYSNNQPNTYTFTKSLAEQIVHEYMDRMPLVVFRPSIVISSWLEPIPGWIDNFNGPTGLLVACGIGIMRTSHGDPDVLSDFVPVDMVVRAMVVATYHKGMQQQLRTTLRKEINVVNCASGLLYSVSLGYIIDLGKRYIRENPMEKTLWVPGGSITRCRVWNLIRFIFLHILVAIVVDCVLRVSNTKPFLVKLQRRIFAANAALHYFTERSWKFKNGNLFLLHNAVPEDEIEAFGFLQYQIDFHQYIRQSIRGAKLFLLNEPADSSKGARMRMKMFEFANFFVQLFGALFVFRFIVRLIYTQCFSN